MERKYKESGIEWIGKIPETWNVDIAKRVFKQRRDKGNEECQLLAATQKYGMYPQHLLEGVVKVAADTDLSLFKTVHKNDYVISLRSFQGGFEMSEYEGVCSPAYQVFYAIRQISSQYYKYLFKSDAFIQEINSLTVGIREGKNILYDDFALLPIPIPPASDQRRIAEYLDKKCVEIDSLIALQEQMIEKLKAYKQSVITEAVAKGLEPNAKLVPSGIDWIGEIPAGWKVTVLRRFAHIILGKMLQPSAKFKEDSLEQYICAKDVHFEGIDTTDLKKMYFNQAEKELYQIQKGDMLVVEGGAGAAGSCVLRNDLPDTYIQNSIMIVRPKQGIDIRYIQYYEFSLVKKGYVDYVCNKATIPHFTKDKLSSMPIPLPPLSEQQAIATYLDSKCTDIDRLIAVKQQKIEKLKDYKKSVIYEAVTGKTIIE
jgi:type I restriction enzyme S subunit